MILILAILLSDSLFVDIQTGYHSNRERSYAVAQIQPEYLAQQFTGDSLGFVLNWVTRANYNHNNLDQAKHVFSFIPLDNLKEDLYYDTRILEALIAQRDGEYAKADTILTRVLENLPKSYTFLTYSAHLNLAKVKRLQALPEERLYHLQQAERYAPDSRIDKVYRNIARYYVDVGNDPLLAQAYLDHHSHVDSLSYRDKYGYYLIQGKISESMKDVESAREYYYQAYTAASMFGTEREILYSGDQFSRLKLQVRAFNYEALWLGLCFTIFVALIFYIRKYGL